MVIVLGVVAICTSYPRLTGIQGSVGFSGMRMKTPELSVFFPVL